MKRALICGVSGQDGAYLAQFLLHQGYEVCGTSRDAGLSSLGNLTQLGIRDQIRVEPLEVADFSSVLQVIAKINPDEIYNLAGQSSVGLSFLQPVETLESICVGTLNLLEAMRLTNRPIKFYHAGSGECFGDTGAVPADEATPFRPRSPYAVSKAAAFWQVVNYREVYGFYACSGILFNHESPLRPEHFVTKKIVAAASRIASGSKERLRLGNLTIERDWGWAPEYVEAMWLMLQQEKADDFLIATGESHKLQEFAQAAFAQVNLNYEDHIDLDPGLFRPADLQVGRANPAKAAAQLAWKAKFKMYDVVRMMMEAERQ